MIRVRKSNIAPDALVQGYNADGVCEQLLADQDDKCYLCERRLKTNYQVEHLASQKNTDPQYVNDWNNLFVACEYCNRKKSDSYDHILSPFKYNLEDIIRHQVSFMQKIVEFESDDKSREVEETIQLLSLLFNGKLSFRNLREQRFYDEFVRKLNSFQAMIDKYLRGEREEYRQAIIEQLDIRSEYLGFKYTIIMENAVLKQDFAVYVQWNRK